MKDEIAAAVVFITKILKRSKNLEPRQVAAFSERLALALVSKFRNHWYEDNPTKGQAFRCIRVAKDEPRDAVLYSAAVECNLDYYRDLNLPVDMTIWVDPHEVVCRFGERGTHCTIASFPKNSTPEIENESSLDSNGNPQINENRIPSPTKVMEQYGSSPPDYDYFYQNNRRNDHRLSPMRQRKHRSLVFTPDQFHWVNGSIIGQA